MSETTKLCRSYADAFCQAFKYRVILVLQILTCRRGYCKSQSTSTSNLFFLVENRCVLATKCCYGEYHSLALFPSFLITFFRVHFFSSSPHHPTLPLHHQPGNFLSQRHLSLCSLDSFPSPPTVICGCTFPLCSFSPLAHTPFVSKACVSNQASISCTCTTFKAGMCNAWVVR